MKLYKIQLNKDDLRTIPKKELLFFIQLTNFANEIYCLQKITFFSVGVEEEDLLIRKALLPIRIRYLLTIQPKIIIGVFRGDRWSPLQAAKKLNIPVVELQHGVLHKYHLLYSFQNKDKISKIEVPLFDGNSDR